MKQRKSSAQIIADMINKEMKDQYGKGWAYMSSDQRQNAVQAAILRKLLGQAGEQFQASQTFCRDLWERILNSVFPL